MTGIRLGWAHLLAIAAAAAIAGLALAGPAAAYRLGGRTWSKRTITYKVTVARYRAPMNEAARQWNASGVNLRFREVRSGRADIVVRRLPAPRGAPSLGAVGRATLGATRPGAGFLLLHPACSQTRLIPVAAHELGHVLGLNHSNRACALMSAAGGAGCPEERRVLPWEVVCRALRADDVAGAIRRYGGRARPLPKDRICVTRPTPGPATGVAIEANPAGSIAATRITWTNPASAALRRVIVNRNAGPCPTYPSIPDGSPWSLRPNTTPIAGEFVGVATAAGGQQAILDLAPVPAGRVCYAVWAIGPDSRYLRAATKVVDHPGLSLDPVRIGLATAPPPPGFAARLSWQNPADPGIDLVRILRSDAVCPADSSAFSGFLEGSQPFAPGPATFDVAVLNPGGPTCFGVTFERASGTVGPFLLQVG